MKKILSILMCLIVLLGATYTGCSIKYTITFDTDGGTLVSEGVDLVQTVTNPKEIIVPIVEKEGYDFVGWDKVIEQIKSNTTVTAQWSEKTRYTITFSGDNAELVSGSDVQHVYDITSIEYPVFEKAGYDFAGWDKHISVLNGNYHLTALWSPKSYILYFVDEQGEELGLKAKSIVYNSAMGQLPTPTPKIGYKFVGWEIDGESINSDTMWAWATNKTAKGVWRLQTERSLVWLNAGNVDYPKTYVEGQGDPIVIQNPEKEGYTFMGWIRNGGAELIKDLVIDPTEEDENLIFVAVWENHKYNLTFETDGGYMQNTTYQVGYQSKVGKLPYPSKSGYKVGRWVLDGKTIDENTIWNYLEGKTLTAEYVKLDKEYLVRFILTCEYKQVNGEVYIIDSKVIDGYATDRNLNLGDSIGVLPIVTPVDNGTWRFRKWKYYYYDDNGELKYKTVTSNMIINEENFPMIKEGNTLIEIVADCGREWSAE